MTKIKYVQFTATGGGKITREGTVLELLMTIPYLLLHHRLPPMSVINNILNVGLVDAGMSGGARWDSFILDEREFEELARDAESAGIEITSPPSWVETRSDFQIWEFELDHGVPSDIHRGLVRKEEMASEKLREAISSGATDEKIKELHLDVVQVGNELSEFLDEYLKTDNH